MRFVVIMRLSVHLVAFEGNFAVVYIIFQVKSQKYVKLCRIRQRIAAKLTGKSVLKMLLYCIDNLFAENALLLSFSSTAVSVSNLDKRFYYLNETHTTLSKMNSLQILLKCLI